jgi:hypothetical protein
MMGPLGLLSPHPGVSYLFSNADGQGPEGGEGSLWGIANPTPSGSTTGTIIFGGSLGSPPPSWTHTLGEMVLKIDGKFKVS